MIVYNLEVEGRHTYIANGAVCHNCECSWEPLLRSTADAMALVEKQYGGGD
jgi:hypothetical protein